VIFAAAALLLLVRMNILEQSEGWLRRRIGDAEVKALFLRGGLAFVAAAVLGTTVLTATAASAPLAGAWDDFDETIVDFAQEINGVIGGVTGPARGPSGLFGDSQTVSGYFQGSSAVVFTAVSSDGAGRRWRVSTYDSWDGDTWHRVNQRPGDRVEPGTPVLAGTLEPIDEQTAGRTPVDISITSVDLPRSMVVAPDAPYRIDRPVTVFTNDGNGPLTRIEFADGIRDGESYQLQALVRTEDEEDGGLTEERLRSAGRSYPPWTQRYFAIQEGSIGDATRATARRLVEQLPVDRRTPYDIANHIEDYLHDAGGFVYREDVRGLCRGDEPLIDCFLQTKQGYCEHFAAAMAMLLRASGEKDGEGIPARVAMGFLPGKELTNGVWQVDRGAAHAWVEVYFPEQGWVEFDPTPGNTANGQSQTELPPGEVVATPTPGPSGDGGPQVPPRPSLVPPDFGEDTPRPSAAAAPTSGGGGGPIPPALVLVVAGLVIAAVAAGTWTRSLRAPAPEPEAVYRGVARLAGRFGYGPSPTQTAYEYAGTLAEIVPTVRGELQTVARAKVEATYAARAPQGDALFALRDAYRRLRVNLLRLAFRRNRR
jgi:transglutaminase-like putative cysteine protease